MNKILKPFLTSYTTPVLQGPEHLSKLIFQNNLHQFVPTTVLSNRHLTFLLPLLCVPSLYVQGLHPYLDCKPRLSLLVASARSWGWPLMSIQGHAGRAVRLILLAGNARWNNHLVYRFTLDSTVYVCMGMGGTSFNPIENIFQLCSIKPRTLVFVVANDTGCHQCSFAAF